MSMDDMECPYCEAGQEVCHDDAEKDTKKTRGISTSVPSAQQANIRRRVIFQMMQEKELKATNAAKAIGISDATFSTWKKRGFIPPDKIDKLLAWVTTKPMPERPSLATIKDMMVSKKLSNALAARALDVTEPALVHWFKGDKRPTIAHLQALAKWVANPTLQKVLYYCSDCKDVVEQVDKGNCYECPSGHVNKIRSVHGNDYDNRRD